MRTTTRRRLPSRFDLADLDKLVIEWRQECGTRVRNRRQLLGVTGRDLADLAGTSESTITRIELGATNVSDRLRMAIAALLRCDVEHLWPYPEHDAIALRGRTVA